MQMPSKTDFSKTLNHLKKAVLVTAVVAGWISVARLGQAETEKRNPWLGLQSHGAPTLAFGGQAYFPLFHSSIPGKQRWDFVRDGDSPEAPTRKIELHMEAKQNLRAFEKAALANRKPVEHQVHYRSAQRQTHSWIEIHPKGRVLHFVDWQLVSDGIQVCEISLCDQIEQERSQSNLWRRELETIVKNTRALLQL
jgi:hypothetical protein